MKNNQHNSLTLITYYGRSGSFFIHSLLDSHPEIINIPPFIQENFFNLFIQKKDKIKDSLGNMRLSR